MTEPRWLLRADPPKDKPKPAQVEALRRAHESRGFAFFMDMGLGKTATALNEFCTCVEDHGFERMVIWAPNNFKPDWELMAKEFRFPYPLHTFRSERRKDFIAFMKKHEGVPCAVALNYEASISSDTREALRKFTDMRKCYVAYDEAIWVKNPQGEYFRALFSMSEWYAASRVLTGKPMTQGPHDLWAQLRMVGALERWNYYAFRNHFCKMGGFKGKQVVGTKNEAELKSYLDRWSFLASKRDWSKLKGKVYAPPIHVELTKEQWAAYLQMEEQLMLMLDEDHAVTAEMIVTKMMKLQQIASGFVIDDQGTAHDLISIGRNPKVNMLRSLLEDQITGKLIVGTYYRHSTELLMEGLAKWKPVRIAGQMDPEEVTENKRLFNSDSGHDVLVGQIMATRYGHTLLGDQERRPCYTTAFFENLYSLDARSQFEDRNHREGQNYEVLYLDFVTSEIDERIIAALQRKEDMVAAVLGFARDKGILPH